MADAKPCVNVVLPAPRFPISAMTLPIGIFSASNFAIFFVSSNELLTIIIFCSASKQ